MLAQVREELDISRSSRSRRETAGRIKPCALNQAAEMRLPHFHDNPVERAADQGDVSPRFVLAKHCSL